MNQVKFFSFPDLCKTIVGFLYSELESEDISYWGCEAISALSTGHTGNQARLGLAGDYMADIFITHQSQTKIIKAAAKAISALSHGNMANRNRLAANDICPPLAKCFKQYMHHMDVTYWMVTSIANLSANNPNIQTKLGGVSMCELLVEIAEQIIKSLKNINDGTGLEEESIYMSKQDNVGLLKQVFWAVGNMVQSGKSSSVIIEGSSKDEVPVEKKLGLNIGHVITAVTTVTNAAGAGLKKLDKTIRAVTTVETIKNSKKFLDLNLCEKILFLIGNYCLREGEVDTQGGGGGAARPMGVEGYSQPISKHSHQKQISRIGD